MGIIELKRTISEKTAEFKKCVEQITAEKRSFSDEEQGKVDALEREINALHSQLRALEKVSDFERSLPEPNKEMGAPAVRIQKEDEEVDKGVRFARYIKASLFSERDKSDFEKTVSRMYPNDMTLRGQNVSTLADGGYLVPTNLANEIIPLLREKSTVRTLGATAIPLPNGNLKIPKQTGAANFTWVGEAQNIIASKASLGILNLNAKKLAGLIPISNELLRDSSIQADKFVLNELLCGIAEAEDITAIYGTGSDNQPSGLASMAGTKTDIAALPTSDLLGTTIGNIMSKKFPNKTNFGWLFNGVLWSMFYNMKDGVGNYIHRAEMMQGKLHGFNFAINNNINVGTDAHGLTEMYFGDFSQFIIGETMGVNIATSDQASYYDGANQVSAFSTDQTIMRAILREDFGVRYADAFIALNKVWSK